MKRIREYYLVTISAPRILRPMAGGGLGIVSAWTQHHFVSHQEAQRMLQDWGAGQRPTGVPKGSTISAKALGGA